MARGKLEPGMIATQKKPVAPLPKGVKLSSKTCMIRLPEEIQQLLDELPQEKRVGWLRELITTEALVELWPKGQPRPAWANELAEDDRSFF